MIVGQLEKLWYNIDVVKHDYEYTTSFTKIWRGSHCRRKRTA